MTELPLHPMWPYATARPVAARWDRVVALAERGMPARDKLDDEWIRDGLRYLNRLNACRDQSEREQLAKAMQDMDTAYRLFITGDKMERAVVESHLLTGQSVEEVATACKLPVQTVVVFEKVFFQVLGRLPSVAFIKHKVIGIDPLFTVSADDTDKMLKWFAYRKGPLFLEIALRYFQNGLRVPERFDQIGRAELEELAAMVKMRAVVLSMTLPYPRCRRAMTLLKLADEVRAIAASLDTPVGTVPAKPAVTFMELLGDSSSEPVPGRMNQVPSWWEALRDMATAA